MGGKGEGRRGGEEEGKEGGGCVIAFGGWRPLCQPTLSPVFGFSIMAFPTAVRARYNGGISHDS